MLYLKLHINSFFLAILSKKLFSISPFLLISIFFLFAQSNFLHSKSISPNTNYQIMDSIANSYAELIYNETIKEKYESINFHINNIAGSQLIEKHLADLCLDNDISPNNDTNSAITHKIVVNQFDVIYQNHSEVSDSLIRIVTLDSFIRAYKDDNQQYFSKKYIYQDTISREMVKYIESSNINFTKSAIPDEDKTFLEKALEPFILVSSAILTVIILFSVRSK